MTAVIRTILGGGGGTTLALGALIALLAAALMTFAPAAADGDPDEFELALSLAEDSDNIVPAGGELTVRADLRFRWEPPITPPAGLPSYTVYSLDVPGASAAASRLRISGDLEWDSAGRLRLDIPAQTPLFSRLPTVAGANQPMAKALDGRTLIARDRAAKLYVFDSYTLQHKATINPPTGADTGLHNGFGASTAYAGGEGGFSGSAIAIWHETAARAWLFVGSWHDTVESTDQLGRLYIFRLDWDAAAGGGVTVTPQGALAPTLAEASNRHGTVSARYGAAVDISRDGGALAVSAPTMNEMGAIYVYSRPGGAGQDWGDITYADGVKVTVAAVPAFGASIATMPFDPDNAGTCDAWCSRVWSNIASQGNYDGVDLGAISVSLSADGQVLAVGAGEKDFASDTQGGGFTGANQRNNAGEAFVWVAPEGGWANAPRADRDADGNAKTLMPAETPDATSFRQATHYSPGPLRRWTEPAAILTPEEWPNRGNGFFGAETTVSPDGAVVAVDDARGFIYLFQQDSADAWTALNGRYLSTPSATFSGVKESTRNPHESPTVFNSDGTALAVGVTAHSSRQGSVLIFSRPADGTWGNAGAADAARRLEPAGARGNNNDYGYVVSELQGPRAVIANRVGRNYLTAPSISGCTVSTVNGVRSASCPLTLPDSKITIPPGTPDGPFTISGTAAVQLGSGDPVTLRDTLEVTIGEVDELARVEFDFDADAATGRPQPAVVEPGGATTLLLKLLNENGKASAKGAASSVLFTVTRGSLSARLGAASGEACATSGEQSCRIANPATALTASNTDQIRLTLTHPGAAKAGVTRVRAVVVGATGQTFETEPLTVTFSGPPTTLAISQPPTALLGHQTSSTADARNWTTLVVSATDASGNKATVPTTRYSAKLTGPDGKEIPTGASNPQAILLWPLRRGGAGDDARDLALIDGNPQATVWVLAKKATPLATGEYTLELSAGSGANKLTATQMLSIAGGAAEVALSADPVGEIELDGSVTLTATVTDASGAPVPDGTPVRFAEQSTGANVALVLLSQSEQRTRNGQASASLRAVGVGGAYVTAEADDVSGAQSITVAAPPPSPPDPIAALTIGSLNTWISPSVTTAAELYAVLEGVSRVSKWDGEEWVGYSETGGRASSGSVDFAIRRGDILWLDGE